MSAKTLPEKEQTLQTLFSRLKIIRNLSLGVSTLGTGLMVGAIKKPLGAPTIVAAATLTALALTSAATAQVLLSLNEQLESMLNQPNAQ
ncbi:hypothetical protein COW36_00935 [bacterium (Candidatus Blackallbacteria) CG17_big_fil_post_rev_8_21_14_2_50_48_46]|uniref:Uncharacterized protein n=1 Tax=bacterium (Candidatus Blackallbacteria) CG17_big_fil_post_rev_8_21_14_2_50_48_46 TaxID=2014261 RepID=A0A2M7GBX0_9BACT|nr:MAG: hypothetical protein COW64_10240 [bacterium (Candidatus Blackallbacteria) CG18_big_fil_WC_8_21_14_2_50_49_26]PIW19433.1 MAG: hypothetical protein COW36_00935 [bacterium (Candidatus Blackallbacteria) CG17_big_fil_post_rev_8_21_14_2_50_48_46]PIW48963.1 MAG: hypothetical protein COW20_07520 [bacterium (Candidatus Blackallbacteria) CG13_big_fil_rev_8_21_14_2_50_49_14]